MTEEIINKDELKNLRFLLQSGQKLAISTKEFERVFDEIERLEQENKELLEARNHFMAENLKYFNALEEIRESLVKLKTNDEDDFTYEYSKIEDKINEVLQ